MKLPLDKFINIRIGAIVKKKQIQNGRHICPNIYFSRVQVVIKKLIVVANCVFSRRLNKLNPVFILEKKKLFIGKQIIVLTVL